MKPFGLCDRKFKSVFQDGCGDYYQSTTYGKWSNFNGALIDTTGTNSRTGIAAIECPSRTGPQVSIPAYTTYFAGVALKVQGFPGGNTGFQVGFTWNNTIDNLLVYVQGNGAQGVDLVGAGGIYASSTPGLLTANTYAYIELGVVGLTSAGAICSVRINGQQVIPPTHVVLSGSPSVINVFGCLAPSGYTMWMDDVYINDNITVAPNNPNISFSGPVRIYYGVPISDTTPLEWNTSSGSAHWSLVNAVPPNGGTDYVDSDTPGNIDQYIFGNLDGITPPVKVVAFCVALNAEIDVAGARTIATQISSTQGPAQALTTSYLIYSTQFDVNPITGNALLLSDLPSLPCGPAVVS
jgi:hypothetical protein